jgi:hypothetical protein
MLCSLLSLPHKLSQQGPLLWRDFAKTLPALPYRLSR